MQISAYKLPFDDHRHPVQITQGYHGSFSHYKYHPRADFSYALDFALPFGTTVLASRGGRIHNILDRVATAYRGLDRSEVQLMFANIIEIDHGDGTIGHYQHLQKGFAKSIGVYVGMDILQGQPVGITGESGWVGPTPHLHFMVYRSASLTDSGGPSYETIPPFSEEELAAMTSRTCND